MKKSIFTKTGLLITILLCMVMLSSTHKQCVPIECITTLGKTKEGIKMTVKEFWVYDNRGRLIMDSINEPEKIWAPVGTEYFQYHGNSILANGQHNYPGIDSLIIETNKSGFPVTTSVSPNQAGYFFYTHFDVDGKIDTIKSSHDNGDILYRNIIDSIIYSEGNIMAYRSRMNRAGDTFMVHCTYYPDMLYKQAFNPTYKMFSVNNGIIPLPGIFNVQVYSKCLIKTMEFNGVSRRYDYRLDEEGKVIHMEITFKDVVYTHTNKYDFKYSCE